MTDCAPNPPLGPYTPPASGSGCPPVATAGLCLSDGTPILVVNPVDCLTGAITGGAYWVNLLTGVSTAGNPPVGSGFCGARFDFELAGIFCETTPGGTFVRTLLLEVEYDSETGAVIGSFYFEPLAPGVPVVIPPGNTVGPCGADELLVDAEVACFEDTGTGVIAPFLLHTVHQNGAVVSKFLTTLDGLTSVPGFGITLVPAFCEPAESWGHEIVDVGNPIFVSPVNATSVAVVATSGNPVVIVNGLPVTFSAGQSGHWGQDGPTVPVHPAGYVTVAGGATDTAYITYQTRP